MKPEPNPAQQQESVQSYPSEGIQYCRYSVGRDKEKADVSIENQKKIQDEFYTKHGITCKAVFTDIDKKGDDWFRPQWVEGIAYCEANNIKLLTIPNYDRLARDSTFQELAILQLKDKGIRVVDTSNPDIENQKVMRKITGVMNEHYKDIVADKSKRVRDLRLKEGLPITPPPYGYRTDKDIKSPTYKQWLIDARKAEKVKQVLNMIAQGANWKDTCKAAKISKDIYYSIKKNGLPVYQDSMMLIGHRIKDYTGKIKSREFKLHQGKHQPIIDRIVTTQ